MRASAMKSRVYRVNKLGISKISLFVRIILKLMGNTPMANVQRYTSPLGQMGDVRKRKFVKFFSFPANKNNAFIIIHLGFIFTYFADE
jgi:hypothetical protein